MTSRNIRLTLSYDGTDFHGWQVQPDQPTIQQSLAGALFRITGEQVLPQGSGRTDAGVHALAQVTSFHLESPIPPANLVVALNDALPSSIRIITAEEAALGFHARHSAIGKTYEYRMYRGDICPPFLARYVRHYPYSLNEDVMMEAAAVVIGEHDFTSFAASDLERSKANADPSNVRTIFTSSWRRRGHELIYKVSGSGFLHHMVRNLVGTFVLAGRGSLDADAIRDILKKRSRAASGPTAPPQGLFLIAVEYP